MYVEDRPEAEGNGTASDHAARDEQRIATEDAVTHLMESLSGQFQALGRLQQAIPCALVVWDEQGQIVEVNRWAVDMLGEEHPGRLTGRPVDELVPRLRTELARVKSLGGSELWREECAWVSKSGEPIPVLTSIAAPTLADQNASRQICVGLDLRERRELELELQHIQKIESLGTLAAGIAHEISTPLQFASDCLAHLQTVWRKANEGAESGEGQGEHEFVLRMDVEDRSDTDEALEHIRVGLKRMAAIVDSMNRFVHRGRAGHELSDINELVRATATIASCKYVGVAELELQLSELPLVECFPADINQVLLNLVVNAAHAVADRERTKEVGPGKITVQTTALEAAVEIVVTDNGVGIPEDLRKRIFDAYFTTKSSGKGTGQGLAISRNIIEKRHNGQLHVESSAEGTSFRIQLPLQQSQTQDPFQVAA